jgi:hypothetical protein
MYRSGLGDCFLISFDVGRQEKHVLIDCGTLGATTTGVKLADAVRDIRAVTNDHLHAVVATHEHWDHVCGFGSLDGEFKKIAVDHVWLAWTEDPTCPLAQRLAKLKKDLGATLGAAATALGASANAASAAQGQAVADILGFFGEAAGEAAGAAAFGESLDAAMQFVRTGLGVEPRYCKPGDGLFDEAGLPGFRVYVLGPPMNEAAIADLGEHGSSELYAVAAGLGAGARGHNERRADEGAPTDDASGTEVSVPFDARFRHPRESPVIQHLLEKTYLSDEQAWRRIDEDWLHVATDLALQLDSATNNTSLVLAFERIADGKVLLFPGDAQQGNWRSWHAAALTWTVPGAAGLTKKVTAADLLARAVFYKVGHHASHNATAKVAGLEHMRSRAELTAFIPVDRAVALGRHPRGSWKMPARALYRRLLEQCNGRVVRSDVGWADDSTATVSTGVEREFDGVATAAEWTAWRKAQRTASHVRITPLFAEFSLR